MSDSGSFQITVSALGPGECKILCVPLRVESRDFPGGAVDKNPPANAGDMGSSPGPGRSHVPRSN